MRLNFQPEGFELKKAELELQHARLVLSKTGKELIINWSKISTYQDWNNVLDRIRD
jgi:hypothetical protein